MKKKATPQATLTQYTPPQATPTQYTPPQATPTPSSNADKNLIGYLDNIKEIPKSVSSRVEKLKEEINNIYEQMKLFEVEESDSALREFAKVYTINGIEGYDPRTFLYYARKNLTKILRNNRKTKVKLILRCDMYHTIKDVIIEFAFHSDIEVDLEGTNEDDIYVIMTERILEKIDRFIKGDDGEGTGWVFKEVMILELHTVSYSPLRGETYIKVQEELANKKAIINIKNEDNKCFL